jgi:hypothetical protein
MVTQRKTTPNRADSASNNPKSLPDTTRWLTRLESADLLNTSTQTLKNYERRGKLHPLRVARKDTRGHEQITVVYDPDELAKLRSISRFVIPREPGDVCAHAFELFGEGKTEQEVLIEVRTTPEVIRDLHEKWFDMGGANLVISPDAKELFEKVVGPFGSVAELVVLVTKLKAATPPHL